MQIRYSADGAYHHEYHIVWIPKYRRGILKGELKKFVEEHLFDIQTYHPDVEVERYSIREVRKRFGWVKKICYREEFWSRGFFSSTVGINEDVIKRYVGFQEKIDKGQMQLNFDFKVPRA